MRPCSIVLCGPIDAIGRAIDRVTGRTGWSHVALDPGLPDGADPLLVDIDQHEGVRLERWSVVVAGRPSLRLELPHTCDDYVRRACMRRVGEPYSVPAMVLQPLQLAVVPGVYCSRVVAECLPPQVRALLPTCPAPADFLLLQQHGGTRAAG